MNYFVTLHHKTTESVLSAYYIKHLRIKKEQTLPLAPPFRAGSRNSEEFKVQSSRFKVQGSRFKVQGSITKS